MNLTPLKTHPHPKPTHIEVGHRGDGTGDGGQHGGASHQGQQEVLEGRSHSGFCCEGGGQGSASGRHHACLQRLHLPGQWLGLLLAVGVGGRAGGGVGVCCVCEGASEGDDD